MTSTPQNPAAQVVTVTKSVYDLIPYEQNPRNNDAAVSAVKASIKEFGFLVPIVVDAENVIVAGHTRHRAIMELIAEDEDDGHKFEQVNVIVAEHLDEEQLRAFRLIDNKTSELAMWDFSMLASEIGYLHETGVDFQKFGWSEQEVDCLTSVVNSDCLTDAHMATLGAAANGEQTSAGEGASGGFNSPGSDKHTAVRVFFGDLGFFITTEDYREWQNELMKLCDYDPKAVIHHVAEMMGLLGAKAKRDALLANGGVPLEVEEVYASPEAQDSAKAEDAVGTALYI
jgi:hypothetical protein